MKVWQVATEGINRCWIARPFLSMKCPVENLRLAPFSLPAGCPIGCSVAAAPRRVVRCSTRETRITLWEVPLGGCRVLVHPARVEQPARGNLFHCSSPWLQCQLSPVLCSARGDAAIWTCPWAQWMRSLQSIGCGAGKVGMMEAGDRSGFLIQSKACLHVLE